MILRCICGAEIRGVEDLFFWAGDGLLQTRCRKPNCRLAKTLTVERVKDRAVIRFSKMFTDYNMLFMGRDLLEKSLGAWTQDCKTAARAKRVKTTHNTSINICRAAQK